MILDFKECASSVVSNIRKDVNGDTVQWNKIHSFQYRKACHDTILLKYNFDRSMSINQGRRRMKTLKDYKLKLYRNRIPISNFKRRDLVTLCNRGLIP